MKVLHISRIEFDLVIESVINYKLTAKRNEHANLILKTTIDSNELHKINNKTYIGEKIVIWGQYDGDSNEKLLFKGIIVSLISHEDNYANYLELKCLSYTFFLDRKEISRSFQNTQKTWKNILKEIVGRHGDVIYTINNRKTNFPMIQYQETDWETCIRIAGHCKTSIFSNFYSDKPQFYFGLPHGGRKEVKHIIRYKWLLSNNWYFEQENSKKDNYLMLSLDTYELINIGDCVIYRDFEGKVISCESRLEKGILVFRYIIGKTASIITQEKENLKIQGAILNGRVLDTQNEKVKIHLFIDNNQSIEEAYWYPWAPESSNIFYCMPEIGTQVALYIASSDEKDAFCIHNVRSNGKSNPEMKDSSDKYMTTDGGKRLAISSLKLLFDNQNKKNPLVFGFYDNEKAECNSGNTVGIFAEGELSLKADNIFLQASSEISIVKKDVAFPTVINMCNSFDVLGSYSEIVAAGSSTEVFPLKKKEEKQNFSLSSQLAEKISSSTPVENGKNQMENCLAGIKVNTLYLNNERKNNE